MSKCERKVVRKSAPETQKLMHSFYPTDRANKQWKNMAFHETWDAISGKEIVPEYK